MTTQGGPAGAARGDEPVPRVQVADEQAWSGTDVADNTAVLAHGAAATLKVHHGVWAYSHGDLCVRWTGCERRGAMVGNARTTPPLNLPPLPPGPGGRATAAERLNLTALRDAMNLAHQTVLAARFLPGEKVQLQSARVAHLLAMCRYERALNACGLPIPPRLRQEARLLRRLLG